MKGIIVTVLPKRSIKYLNVKPQGTNVVLENLNEIKAWAVDNLHKLPESEKDCQKYFLDTYNQISKETSSYYVVEQYFNRENNNLEKSYCRVLGPGKSIEDAYSTQLLFPTISEGDDGFLKKSGYFVEVSKDEFGVLNFNRLEADYDLMVMYANSEARDKLKRMSLEIPTDSNSIPSTLQYSQYWSNITANYTNQLAEQNALGEMKELNKQYADAEAGFYKYLALYREYKEINAKTSNSLALAGFMLQASSIIASSYENNRRQNEIQQIQRNEATFSNEINRIQHKVDSYYRNAEQKRLQQLEHLRRNRIPINDSPKLPSNWSDPQ